MVKALFSHLLLAREGNQGLPLSPISLRDCVMGQNNNKCTKSLKQENNWDLQTRTIIIFSK